MNWHASLHPGRMSEGTARRRRATARCLVVRRLCRYAGRALRQRLRIAFVLLVAYPVCLLWLGINARHRERLPLSGPAIVAANHNSHLDTLALLALFPLRLIPRIRPVAAADYFMRPGIRGWLARNVLGIIPVERGGTARGIDPLGECYAALSRGEILVIFPEGTRGEPERMAALKSGVWHLARRFSQAPVVPVFMHGLGRSLPKGGVVPVPLFVDLVVGRPLAWSEDKAAFMRSLAAAFVRLRAKLSPAAFDDSARISQEQST